MKYVYSFALSMPAFILMSKGTSAMGMNPILAIISIIIAAQLLRISDKLD